MSGRRPRPRDTSAPRKAALAAEESGGQQPADLEPDMQEIVHELQTHQVELEIQNEHLRQVQEELVAARDLYEELYDQSPVGYLTIRPPGIIVGANLTIARMLGVERGALINARASAYVLAEDQDTLYLHYRKLSDHRLGSTCELRMQGFDGSVFWAQLISIPVVSPQGGDLLVRTAISDVTARVKAEEEQKQLEKQVQHLQKLESLGVLAGGIAHDFNNVLMVIMGNLDVVLRMESSDSPARKCLDAAKAAARKASALTAQMLAYAGSRVPSTQWISMNSLIEEMTPLLEVAVPKKIVMETDLAPKLTGITADPVQMQQVILNLVTNAAEAIGDQDGKIVLSTRAVKAADMDDSAGLGAIDPMEGELVCLMVSDTGSGMDAATQEKLYDPFFSTKFVGRGLGLAAVLGIVQGHGGCICFKSREGQGTVFRVYLPVGKRRSSVDSKVSSATSAPIVPSDGLILVVDDEPGVRKICASLLEHIGYTTLTARDGAEALEVFRQRQNEICAVVLDMSMPHMDGIEVLAALRDVRADIPVLFASGLDQSDRIHRLADHTFIAAIQKPFDAKTLAAALRTLLRQGEE